MAEGLLASALPDSVVNSAGLGALVGEPAHPRSIELMADRGIDISGHIARQLCESMLVEHDMILTMEQVHSDFISDNWPQAHGRIFRWGHWEDFDVPDPYRRGDDVFLKALELIDRGLHSWTSKLRRLG